MSAVHQQLLGEGRRVAWVRLCRLPGVARSTLYYQSCPPRRNEAVDGELAALIKEIIEEQPAFGVRRVHVQLTKARGLRVNRKKVHRVMRLKGWTMRQRSRGRRPRAEKSKSVTERPDERWASRPAKQMQLGMLGHVVTDAIPVQSGFAAYMQPFEPTFQQPQAGMQSQGVVGTAKHAAR